MSDASAAQPPAAVTLRAVFAGPLDRLLTDLLIGEFGGADLTEPDLTEPDLTDGT